MKKILEAIERWRMRRWFIYFARHMGDGPNRTWIPVLTFPKFTKEQIKKIGAIKELNKRERVNLEKEWRIAASKPVDRKDCRIRGYQASEIIEDEWVNPPCGGSNVEKGEVKE